VTTVSGGSVTVARKGLKAAVLPFGLPGWRRTGDVVILLYHRVGEGGREVDLPVRSFERHLARLAEGAPVRSLDEALSDNGGGVVLTFDDGYRDFHEHVLPLLECHRIPAVLYLATGLVDGQGEGVPSSQALSWTMLREAVATGLVTVGSHTHSHADLSRTSEAEAEEEMARSKNLIEDNLQLSCRHFAYPWAVASPAAERAARRLFETAALDAWKTNRRGRTNPYRLGRTPILRSDGDGLFFRAKTVGILDRESLVYRALRRGPWRES
jgi:peptidoglycan/xylan/chitin deacetylase (PgdA/CDA1 family)